MGFLMFPGMFILLVLLRLALFGAVALDILFERVDLFQDRAQSVANLLFFVGHALDLALQTLQLLLQFLIAHVEVLQGVDMFTQVFSPGAGYYSPGARRRTSA